MNSLAELIALAKREPGKLSYGHDGNGTASHLTMELLKSRGNFALQPVPYKGSAPLVNDVIGGQVPVGITGLPAVQAHAKSGKLRILAVTTGQRWPTVPEIGSVAEQGFGGFSAPPWSGFFLPEGTPGAVVDRIAADLIAVMELPEVRDRMRSLGSNLAPNGPQAFRAFVQNEIDMWAEAVKASGARID